MAAAMWRCMMRRAKQVHTQRVDVGRADAWRRGEVGVAAAAAEWG